MKLSLKEMKKVMYTTPDFDKEDTIIRNIESIISNGKFLMNDNARAYFHRKLQCIRKLERERR